MELEFESILWPALQALALFALSPLVMGVMHKVKARFQGRTGAPIWQPYIDVSKLMMKGVVVSPVSSWVFIAAPVLSFSAMLVAAAALPIFVSADPFHLDLVAFVYLFAIGRFMTALAGLDIGSAFGGIGSSREMLYSSLIEPAIFAAIVFFSTMGAGAGLSAISGGALFGWPAALLSPAYWLAAVALLIVILAETGRLPFDNPATHLELTMVHEAMVLDCSGPLLGLVEWANAAKITVLFALFLVIFTPISSPAFISDPALSAVAFAAAIMAIAVFTATLESLTPKWRLFRISELLTLSLILSFLAYFLGTSAKAAEGSLLPIIATVMLVMPLNFIFSASFGVRIRIFLFQSLALAFILLIVALGSGSIDAYWRLGSTILFKVIIVPWLLLFSYRDILKKSKDKLRADPISLASSLSTSKALLLCGVLILFSYSISSLLGIHDSLLPVALSIIFIGAFIIAIKSHIFLQMLGFLILENGLVLMPVALSLHVPLLGELVAFIDTLILVAVSLFLASKIQDVHENLDSVKLNRMFEAK